MKTCRIPEMELFLDAQNDESTIVTQSSQSNRMLSTTEINSSSTDSSSTSNKSHVKCQRYKNRSYETTVMKYADKMKETFEENQEKVKVQTNEYICKLIASEKEAIDKILDSQRVILKETTNQLLQGLQNIFGVATYHPTQTVNTSQTIPSIVPTFNQTIPYLYPNAELRQYQSPVTPLPKVLINLKRPASANEEMQNVKIQKLNSCSSINSQKEEAINNAQKNTSTDDKI